MIECIFTIDYEIYGTGAGSLNDLVYEPAQQLKRVFDATGDKLVIFVEAAELEIIAAAGTDPVVQDVQAQIREFHEQGYEIALHLHPQWYNARHQAGAWELDYKEYNLCTLPRRRIQEIVRRSIAWLRGVLACPAFTPLSFRAGNWLFQPTTTAAEVLAENGIKVDSSVFKGGVRYDHRLDYRPAQKNGYYWRFGADVNTCDPRGAMLEVPIYTSMVPFWRMLTTKRVTLEQKAPRPAPSAVPQSAWLRINRLRQYLRFFYPLKFDFCRMTLAEMTAMLEAVIRVDRRTPGVYKPLVAIGHTKDLEDFDTIARFLDYLRRRSISVVTFPQVLQRVCDS
jgi:hypothetical protein